MKCQDQSFSANTIAGLPVIEAFSDHKVKLGPAHLPAATNSTKAAFTVHETGID